MKFSLMSFFAVPFLIVVCGLLFGDSQTSDAQYNYQDDNEESEDYDF
jgi:hypothetical protein